MSLNMQYLSSKYSDLVRLSINCLTIGMMTKIISSCFGDSLIIGSTVLVINKNLNINIKYNGDKKMTDQEIFNKVKEIIVSQTGEDEKAITLAANVKEDLNVDSLDIFEMINELENEFDIEFKNESGINTVQDLVDFVKKNNLK